MINTVIFDMDGTVTDTQTVYGHAWLALGLTNDQYHQLIGSGKKDSDKMLTSFGYDPDEIRARKNELVLKELKEDGIALKKGAVECLKFLKENGYRTCIATSSSLETAMWYMEETGIGKYFDEIISGHELTHSKPDPEVFLLAAQKLGSDPSECCVVEDSYSGVKAGAAAKMVTVMIPDAVAPNEEMDRLSSAILGSLLELPDFLTGINTK